MAYGAEAITAVRLCGMEHSVFFKECSCSPRFAMNYAEAVTREAMLAWSHVGALGQQSARGRVANLLVELHQRVRAIEGGEGPAVWLPINQTHIADATGLTAVHVCRTLKRMRQEGLLEFSKGRLVLIDPSRLAAVA
jgi:CRP-like cAMP-binding protein